MFLLAPQRNKSLRRNADVAQLVAHHLAKVRVASSSLVIRSTYLLVLCKRRKSPTVEWPSGEAKVCKTLYTGSIPVSTSIFI